MSALVARLVFFLALLLTTVPLAAQVAQGAAFTYQGELRQNNLPVTASVDMVFTLHDAATTGTQIGTPIALTAANSDAVQVVNGIFTVTLDFDAPSFITTTDDARWLEVMVAGNVLVPRTKIENAPYALTSQLAYNVVAGSIGTAQINSAQVQRRVSASCAAGSSISVINTDGTVSCQSAGSGTITGVAAGTGLSGGGTSGTVTLAADTSVVQKRVGSACPSGSSISTINPDGTVACQAAGIGTVTSIKAGNGLTGGTITSSGTLAVDPNVVLGTTWNLAGNTNLPAGSFFGTTDNSSVMFKVNNVQAGLLQPTPPNGAFFDEPNVIFGSSANMVGAGIVGATIGGGGARACPTAPCPPNPTTLFSNSVSANYATIGGGSSNYISGFGAMIGGGNANSAAGTYSTIGGGQLNSATGVDANVAGGQVNAASGFSSAVTGGSNNTAGGDYSFAGGLYARVRSAADIGSGNANGDQGTFIWSDATATSANPFVSSGVNQFLVKASGGAGINATPQNPYVEFTISGNSSSNTTTDLTLLPYGSIWGFDLYVSGTGQNDAVFGIAQTNGTGYTGLLGLDHSGNFNIAGATATKPGGGSWSAPSDIRLKRDVQPLAHMLDRLLQLRGVSFEYKQPDDNLHRPGRHTGFIAQEVQQVFPEWVGQTPDGYLSVGPQGFEAMTVEALRELRAEKDDEIAQLKSEKDVEIAELRREFGQLAAQLNRIQAKPTQAQP